METSASSNPQPAEPETRTVEIRGVQSEDEVAMCFYHFENPAEGGGDVERHVWNEEEDILFVTFKDPKVAKTVSTRKHTVAGKALDVCLYYPPAEEPEDCPAQCTVEVRRFHPAKTELYRIYFSSQKHGGGTVVDLSLSDDQTVMYIMFETPEVARRVAAMSHTVSGQQLDVTVTAVQEPPPPCTVIVRDCDPEKQEKYLYYFETPSKGGGDIADFVVDEEKQTILITFEDPEVARVVAAGQHTIAGRTLNVSLYTPQRISANRGKPQEPAEEEEASTLLRTVVVSMGQQPLKNEDTMALYFESPRCGGGEVESVQYDEDKQLAYVTFANPAVAERVAQNAEHVIMGYPAKVSLYKPPKPIPTYPDKLLFQNVADGTTRDCLWMYLERITGMEPLDLLYGDDEGTVLVTFPQEPDFPQTLQMAQQRTLEDRHLAVFRVPVSRCLLVESLSNTTTTDTVCFYFENPRRSRGGHVERVEMFPEGNKCLVYFENHQVLDGVLSQQHSVEGRELRVRRYLECLGESGGSRQPTAFTMPPPLALHSLDSFKVAFLRHSQSTKSTFLQQLTSSHAEGKFEGDKLIIDCTLTPAVPKARILARTWSVDVQQTVTQFLALMEVKSHKVMQLLWIELAQAVREAGMSYPDGATLFPVPEDATFVVVGMKNSASQLSEQVGAIITAKEVEIERRKQQVTETNSKLKTSQLSLLKATGFGTAAGQKYESLNVDVQETCIVFQGMLGEVKEAQINMYEILQTMTTNHITSMTDRQKKVLGGKETKRYIAQKLKTNNIAAVWELSQQGDARVFAFEDTAVVQASSVITQSVVEHVCQLSPESTGLFQHQDSLGLLSQLKKTHADALLFTRSRDNLQLFVTSIDSILRPVVKKVEKFLAENTIYSKTVRFSPSCQKLVYMKWKNKVQSMAADNSSHKVSISMPEPGDKIQIKGTRTGLEQVMKSLELLNRQIVCHEEVLTDPNKVKLLSWDCSKDLKVIGGLCQCVLTLQPEVPHLQEMDKDTLASASRPQTDSRPQMAGSEVQTTASVQLPSGVTVAVVQGDITQMAVGAIVNAANTRMDHHGGLAEDIVRKGGDIIQKECHEKVQHRSQKLRQGDVIVSGPGKLRCQSIIHAIGPMYKDGQHGEQDCLFKTIMTCLQTASDANLPSIAIPAISTGLFQYPEAKATMVIVQAVKIFLDSAGRCVIKSVYLCHFKPSLVALFDRALKKTFSSVQSSAVAGLVDKAPQNAARFVQSFAGYQSPAVKRDAVQPVARSGIADRPRILRVSLISGEIAKQSADVIVNSAPGRLALDTGSVSSSILKATGPSLQLECTSKYPKGIQKGQLARTMGHGLNCREIFHIVLHNYTSLAAQQVLSDTVVLCLSQASQQLYTSLAFPVLGTGILMFPASVAAQTMLDAIDRFEKTTPSTSLRDVKIVVYPADHKNMQEFQSAQSAQSRAGGSPSGATGASDRLLRTFSGQPSSPSAQSWQEEMGTGGGSYAEFEVGELCLVIKEGDITEEDTDAIVSSINSRLDFSIGGVASALNRKCGPQLEAECRAKVNEFQDKGIIMTKSYGLKSSFIVHVDFAKFRDFSKIVSWEDGIDGCLKLAEQNGLRSIAMPALGTGVGLSPSKSALALFKAVVKMYKDGKHKGSLDEVRVVLFDKEVVPTFIEAVQQTEAKHNRSRKGIINRIKSGKLFRQSVEVKQTFSSPVVGKVSLFVYAESQSDVVKALEMLDETTKEKCIHKDIKDEVISSFDEKDISRVREIGERHKVDVQLDTSTGRIVCDGLRDQVYECLQEVKDVIRDVEQGRQQDVNAAMLARILCWCFLEVTVTGTEQMEYLPKENLIIERAYLQKSPCAEIADDAGRVYIIDFNSMMEYPKDDPSDTASVIRKDRIKDLAGGQVPKTWEPQGASETVRSVTLSSTDLEYQTVAQDFSNSVGNARRVIKKIERVQNPHLYHQYVAKKAQLQEQNPGLENEKTLWHGTEGTSITNINRYGFNRSYCGKNATAFGQGVYFAVNASYSDNSTYSPSDHAGNRCMYRCKVLVGSPTTGQPNLRVLPTRSGPVRFDSAIDNPHRPAMYVIFNDTQAYPEHLITFK
ncbi:hypothetical protein ACOMHN_064764 [Nucella lapillus]